VNVPNTEKLYLDDPYETDFRARVLSVTPRGDSRSAVVLDRSCFYPESGGQTADRGKLGEFEVVDVQEGDGESVVHVVSGAPGPDGEIAGHIDWPRRFDHMQQHTGQHVLSRAFIEVAGLETVSFHMGDDTCTIDLAGKGYDEDTAARAEALANRIVAENLPVVTRSVPLEEVDQQDLRRRIPEGVTLARLVEVSGFDTVPCCGTHVAATGELRLIKILKHERARGNERVYFKVGTRAIADYDEKHEILATLSQRLSTSAGDVVARVDKLLEENQDGRKAIRRLAHKLAVVEKDLLIAAAEPVGGARLIARVIRDADADYLRILSGEIRGASGVVALLASGDGSVLCVASDDVEVELAGPVVDLARAMGGSGGGKGAFAQVMLPGGADVNAFLANVEEDVRRRL